MSSSAFFRLLFVVYCVEAGLFFVTAPWFPAWERLAFALPFGAWRDLALSGWVRGAVTAFGSLHWLWALHDLDSWIRARFGSGRIAPLSDPDPTRAATSTSPASETARGR